MKSPIANALDKYEPFVRSKLLQLRELVMDEAALHPEIGELVETLKWGQLSYLPGKPRIGTTVRFDIVNGAPKKLAMFVSCQSSLLDTYRQLYPDTFSYSGNRAVMFNAKGGLPEKELRHCIALALTYHLRKKHQALRKGMS